MFLGGVLPTPGAPLLIAPPRLRPRGRHPRVAQPVPDNGIKFFGADGYKLSDATEEAIEGRLDAPPLPPAAHRAHRPHPRARGVPRRDRDRFGTLDLSGTKVLLDCANGVTFHVAPAIFRRLRAQVTVLNDQPDGRNINEGCGSTHVEALAGPMREGGHDIGFAFDGDGDRVLAVDRNGVVDDAVAVHREHAVAVAVEGEADVVAALAHRAASASTCVEPEPSLMLRPSGSSCEDGRPARAGGGRSRARR